jgi:hypothetical protein
MALAHSAAQRLALWLITLHPRATFADMNTRLDKLHDQIEAMSFDDAISMIDRFNRETATEVRERPQRCVIALSSLLVQAKMLSDKMDHEDVLRARRLARAIIKADA